MRKPAAKADTRPPVAISYQRFSDPKQRKGDSRRRQTEGAEGWCARHNVSLDTTLVDPGRSAYHGRHRSDKAALGNFLQLVKEGKVPRGSFLVIENLDRLSREDERTALRLWLDILDAGVSIVQLHPETVFQHERSDMVDIMRAIIELSRGHSESRMKSVRSLANWERAVTLARENGRPITRRLPAWVERSKGGGLGLVRQRAAAVRRIFELAAAGYGMTSIVKKLDAENVPAFGGRVADDDGHYRQADGECYGCGEWRTSYVRSILRDRRAIGEYQPRDATERKKGDPIPDYYPRVVSDREFYAAQAAVSARRSKQGRIGKNVANLFGGLLRNARDGDTYYAATRSDNGAVSRVLLNKSSVEGKSPAFTFPYATFERKLLEELREINPRDVEGGAPVTEVSVLQGELNWLRQRKAALALELMKGDVATIGDALRQLEAREAKLMVELQENAETTAAPRVDTWRDAKSLIGMLDKVRGTDKEEDVRLRLRAALRRVVAEIWLLVVPRGRDKVAACQLRFADGQSCRTYVILHRRAQGNQHGRQEGDSWVRSVKNSSTIGRLDLRDRKHVRQLEELLRTTEVEEVE